MKSTKYIYKNQLEIICFDKYFSYLNKMLGKMPKMLFDFANDKSRYELNNDSSLHDAWLTSFVIRKEYLKDVATQVSLDLLLASHEKSLRLIYKKVLNVQCSFSPDFWPNEPVDLLFHEFSVNEDDSFRHYIQFDRGVRVELCFMSFEYLTLSE